MLSEEIVKGGEDFVAVSTTNGRWKTATATSRSIT